MYEIAQRTAFSLSANWCGTRLTYKLHDMRKACPLDCIPSKSFSGAGLSIESKVLEVVGVRVTSDNKNKWKTKGKPWIYMYMKEKYVPT
jgi:hypothetical protein